MRKLLLIVLMMMGCLNDADMASQNLSRSADNFEIRRRIIFYNGITGEYILTMKGLCSLRNMDKPHELSVVCKTGPKMFKKHFLGLSDNVTYLAEQLDETPTNIYQFEMTFKPSIIVPSIQVR
jgi:hypothetical protein